MAEPFLAQIVMFAGNFAPRGWAFCDGQLLPINQNQAVFSLLGTTYGGDGRTTFGLPDMRGRVSVHPGSGPGLTSRTLGQKGGSENNTLNVNQMPAHNHTVTLRGTGVNGTLAKPQNNHLAGGTTIYGPAGGTLTNMAADAAISANTGGGQAVNNMEPFLCVNYIIALQGVFPSRN